MGKFSLSGFMLITFLSLFVSCQNAERGSFMEYDDGATARTEESMSMSPLSKQAAGDQMFTSNTQAPTELVQMERKLIKEGDVSFETDDLAATRMKLEALLKMHKGYIANENNYSQSNAIQQYVTVRIPAVVFDDFMEQLLELAGKFETKNIQVRDVTEEFIDITTRLETKKALEQRYVQLLEQAKTVKDILEIEQQLGNLRSDIESMEGRLRYLNSQVGFSTLRINFYKKLSPDQGFMVKFEEGFSNGWDNLIYFLIGLVNVWPFLFLIPIFIWLLRKMWGRGKKKKAAPKQPQPNTEA